MATKRIKYVTKTGKTHETITRVGSDTWKETKAEAIKAIEGGTHSYYTDEGGKRAEVKVVDSKERGKYLQTYADGKWSNNLLALPDFPS